MRVLDNLLGLVGLTRKSQAPAPEQPRVALSPARVAEYMNTRGLKSIELPVAGVSALFRRPRTIEVMRAGLFPLKMTQMDLEKLSPEEREKQLEEADAATARLICECSVEPRIVNRRARPDEIRLDALDDADFAQVGQELIAWIFSAHPEPPQDPHPHYEQNMDALAGACKVFGIDPTEVLNDDPKRAEQIIDMAMRTIRKDSRG